MCEGIESHMKPTHRVGRAWQKPDRSMPARYWPEAGSPACGDEGRGATAMQGLAVQVEGQPGVQPRDLVWPIGKMKAFLQMERMTSNLQQCVFFFRGRFFSGKATPPAIHLRLTSEKSRFFNPPCCPPPKIAPPKPAPPKPHLAVFCSLPGNGSL